MFSKTEMTCPDCGQALNSDYEVNNDHRGSVLTESFWCAYCRKVHELPLEYVETEPIKEDRVR